ncbi:MAG: DNA recombination protein RmuC [Reinekea sp.]
MTHLSHGFRNEKKVQGNWGEMVLENVLDGAGLVQGKDYTRERSLLNMEEDRRRLDVLVNLPQDRHLVVDAKVSLVAYTRYVNAESELERTTALRDHVTAVGDRINELADKEYGKLNGINSPDMVILFMPVESAFVEALKADETLFQKALENHVLVATPTTLLASLNIVKQLWRFENQNKHTAKLAEKAELVFKKLKTFLESFQGVKAGLLKAMDSYEKAEGQLVNGRGNLVNQVNSFKELAPQIRAELPEQFSEKAALELEIAPELGEAS